MRMKHLFLTLIILFTLLPLGFAQAQRPIVRLIYFLPSDRQPQLDIDAKMDRLIKDVQLFYAEQMETHGFGRKTFQFETDGRGNAVVHHVKGQFTDRHYSNLSLGIWDEIDGRFDTSKNIYLTAIDISSERISTDEDDEDKACGVAIFRGNAGGVALIPASGDCFNRIDIAAHELGHTFWLEHDPRNKSYLMASTQSYEYIPGQVSLSYCAAEWLNVHRAFNSSRVVSNDEPATIEMLPPSFASTPNAIRLRFKVSDPDGLYQAHALADGSDEYGLVLGCKQLNGNTRSTFEIVTTHLPLDATAVSLQIIDRQGDSSYSESYPINIIDLLPSAKVVTIPDAGLAAAVREALELTSDTVLTTFTILDLRVLNARERRITDLTGLEHAHNLEELNLYKNNISDISPLAGLTRLTYLSLLWNNISDVSPLAGLTRLINLDLGGNTISDVSALSSLTQLTELWLSQNSISDVSPLAGLTRLTDLHLGSNNISDVSPLAGLTQLKVLYLDRNEISDVSPLVGLNLTGTRQYIGLRLAYNPLSYASHNTHIPAMQAKGSQVKVNEVEGSGTRTYSALLKVSGDAQEGAVGTTLTTPFVVEAMDANGMPMQGVSVIFTVTAGGGRLSATTATTDARGRARTTLTLGQRSRRNTVRATAEGIRSFAIFNATVPQEPTRLAADVNGDGAVNIQDLVLVASRLGQAGQNKADVNGDGAVNIQDLVLVAGELGTHAAAPSAWHHTAMGIPTRATVEQWLTQAHGLSFTDARSQRGILLLERLLATLAPEETALLTNYPNPFNPETWIPYHLSKPADVTLTIYSVDGKVVRRLDLGHQVAGYYQSRSRAAYWDGRNAVGERVASGLYFYTLTAGDFAATKKLLIRK